MRGSKPKERREQSITRVGDRIRRDTGGREHLHKLLRYVGKDWEEGARVSERERYPLHCGVTGNLIEREEVGRGEREGRSDAMQKLRARVAVVGMRSGVGGWDLELRMLIPFPHTKENSSATLLHPESLHTPITLHYDH